MASLNKVQLIGNLGKDPDIRRTQNGEPVANFSVATSESWTDKNTHEKKEQTEWHRVVAFGKLAEIIEKYCTKGMRIYCEGKLVTRKYTDKDNVERYTTEIQLTNFNGKMIMLSDGRGRNGNGDHDPGDTPQRGGTRTNIGGGRRSDMDDEIPF